MLLGEASFLSLWRNPKRTCDSTGKGFFAPIAFFPTLAMWRRGLIRSCSHKDGKRKVNASVPTDLSHCSLSISKKVINFR